MRWLAINFCPRTHDAGDKTGTGCFHSVCALVFILALQDNYILTSRAQLEEKLFTKDLKKERNVLKTDLCSVYMHTNDFAIQSQPDCTTNT